MARLVQWWYIRYWYKVLVQPIGTIYWNELLDLLVQSNGITHWYNLLMVKHIDPIAHWPNRLSDEVAGIRWAAFDLSGVFETLRIPQRSSYLTALKLRNCPNLGHSGARLGPLWSAALISFLRWDKWTKLALLTRFHTAARLFTHTRSSHWPLMAECGMVGGMARGIVSGVSARVAE